MQTGIRVRYKLHPSSLLWLDSLSQAGKDLQARCRQTQACDPVLLQGLANDARELLALGDANGCATVLICLADRCREGGELILARECCEEPESLFCCYEDIRHVHNRAVALYALGRVYEDLDLRREAIATYDRALEAFQRACAEWRWIPDCAQRRRDQCNRAEREIHALRAGLASARPAPVPPSSPRVPVWVLSATSAGAPVTATEELEEWVDLEQSVAGHASYALRVEGDSMIDAGIMNGDVVLMQRTAAWPGDGQIVAVRIDGVESESVLKRFYRRRDHICLQPANNRYPFLIVVPDWRLKGRIEERYARSHPTRQLEFLIESAVHCAGWYLGKVQ